MDLLVLPREAQIQELHGGDIHTNDLGGITLTFDTAMCKPAQLDHTRRPSVDKSCVEKSEALPIKNTTEI
jgi:hypothetical protein